MNNQFLTRSAINKIAPAATKGRMTKQEIEDQGRSERFQFFSTNSIIKDMEELGWGVVGVKQTKVQAGNEARIDTARHLIRFRSEAFAKKMAVVGDLFPEILMTNANDGTAKLKLHGGIYRYICGNGMNVLDQKLEGFQVKHHISKDFELVRTYVKLITERMPLILNDIQRWSKIEVNPRKAKEFATRALVIRHNELVQTDFFGGRTIDAKTLNEKYRPAELLKAQRPEDGGSDLWHLFNRVQENLLKGNYTHHTQKLEDGEMVDTSKKARTLDWAQDPTAPNFVNFDVRKSLIVNKQLWGLTQQFAQSLS